MNKFDSGVDIIKHIYGELVYAFLEETKYFSNLFLYKNLAKIGENDLKIGSIRIFINFAKHILFHISFSFIGNFASTL